MNGEVLSKTVLIMFIAAFAVEVYLSHQNGKDSGAVSSNLSIRIHISEKMLRTGAHIGFFAVMTVLASLVCRVMIVAVAVWAIMDEVTKPLLGNGRHCSIVDIGWNLIGVAVGFCAWTIAMYCVKP